MPDLATIIIFKNPGIQGIVINNTELMKPVEFFVFGYYCFLEFHHYLCIEGIPEIHQGCVVGYRGKHVACDNRRIEIFIQASSRNSRYPFVEFNPIDRGGPPVSENPVKHSASTTSDIHKNVIFNQYLVEQNR